MTRAPVPTSTTRIVGLLGWPVAHSLSPRMHNAAFEALGLDFCYVPLPVPPEPAARLGEAVAGLRALGIRGGNVTVPHKQRVLAFVDELTPVARSIGAVNTLSVGDDGRILGDNTDGPGLVAYLEHSGVAIVGRSAMVIGAGGAARAAVAGLLASGCGSIVVLNRTVDRAKRLVREVGASFPDCAQASARASTPSRSRALQFGRFPDDLAACAGRADLVLQCSSLGMGDDMLAWDPSVALREGQVVCDLVYHPRTTALLRLAQRSGARALPGIGMLVHQGALSFTRWTGAPAPIEVMMDAVQAG